MRVPPSTIDMTWRKERRGSPPAGSSVVARVFGRQASGPAKRRHYTPSRRVQDPTAPTQPRVLREPRQTDAQHGERCERQVGETHTATEARAPVAGLARQRTRSGSPRRETTARTTKPHTAGDGQDARECQPNDRHPRAADRRLATAPGASVSQSDRLPPSPAAMASCSVP